MTALSGLKEKLEEMRTYLSLVEQGKLPVNNQVGVRALPCHAMPCHTQGLGVEVHLLTERLWFTYGLADHLRCLQIIYNLQTIFNLLPNLNVEELIKSVDCTLQRV
jgi:hypothetical protein